MKGDKMFLISDKLDKSESQYDLMKEQKDDLEKSEIIDFATLTPSKIQKCDKSHFIYALLIGIVFFFAIWTMMTPKYYELGPNVNDVGDELARLTYSMVNNTQYIINAVREREADIIEENKRSADEFIGNIRDILKSRTDKTIQRVNEIITDKIRETENELTGFDVVIKEAADGIIDVTRSDIEDLRSKIADIEAGNATKSLDVTIKEVQKEIESMWNDLDQMYTFYTKYIYDIIQHKMQHGYDRLSKFLAARRRKSDCTILDKINMCFNISTQNIVLGEQVKDIMKAFEIASNFTSTVDSLEPVFENAQEYHREVFQGVKLSLDKVMQDTQQTLDSLLKDDCFLGTTIRKAAFVDHTNVKQYILQTFKTTLDASVDQMKRILSEFTPVHDDLWNPLRTNIHSILAKIGEDLKSKAMLINKTSVRDEYVKKTEFSVLKSWMDTKFQNVTSVINPLFEEHEKRIIDAMEVTSQWLQSQHVPFVSMLSVQNYLPTDVCPLSVNYQNYLASSLEAAMAAKTNDMDDVIEDATYFSTDNFSVDIVVPVDMVDESVQTDSKDLEYDNEVETSVDDLKNVDIKKMIPEQIVEAIEDGSDFSDDTAEEEEQTEQPISVDLVDITILLPDDTVGVKIDGDQNINSTAMTPLIENMASNTTQDEAQDQSARQMFSRLIDEVINTLTSSPNDLNGQLDFLVDDGENQFKSRFGFA